jgi:hypothetical protein
MFVRGKESSEELWSDVSHFPGEVPLTPPASASKRAMRDEETPHDESQQQRGALGFAALEAADRLRLGRAGCGGMLCR